MSTVKSIFTHPAVVESFHSEPTTCCWRKRRRPQSGFILWDTFQSGTKLMDPTNIAVSVTLPLAWLIIATLIGSEGKL